MNWDELPCFIFMQFTSYLQVYSIEDMLEHNFFRYPGIIMILYLWILK